VIVTHDTELLRRLRPRVVMLHAGRVLFDGSFDAFAASDDPHILPYRAQMGTLHEDGGHDLAPTGGEPRTGPTAGHPG
jgi:phospholipid/cholesterol/gamma-HCH transport system ATP-binding protein